MTYFEKLLNNRVDYLVGDTHDQLRDRTLNNVEYRAWSQARKQVYSKVENRVWNQVGCQIYDQAYDEVEKQLYDKVAGNPQ